MLYKIGTQAELAALGIQLPDPTYTELYTSVMILDSEYGENRNYMESGGYSVVLESKEDLPELKRIVDYDAHPCEWATRISGNCGYLSALYLMNDDYAIMAFMPIDIAPDAILKDLED